MRYSFSRRQAELCLGVGIVTMFWLCQVCGSGDCLCAVFRDPITIMGMCGLLLYTEVDERLCYDMELGGYDVSVRSLNLNQPWKCIHDDLLALGEEIKARCVDNMFGNTAMSIPELA